MTKNANTAAEQASMDELIKLIEQRAATYSLLSGGVGVLSHG